MHPESSRPGGIRRCVSRACLSSELDKTAVHAQIAELMGVPVERQRLWRWARRESGAYRPVEVVDASCNALGVAELQRMFAGAMPEREPRVSANGCVCVLDMYLEVRLQSRG